ncbi:Arylsulfatase precursor [Posidoniimonas polymericola]|uniref:Arylsulfatase n=1 Tax=Posidoniimonas polymericola TaxID=2528002 RepID=A0A5C5YRH3_9BACT|nr:sulfatase-like hydrolase/transferase [Posidoniimonas polymericola]TWT77526.1 Arylsulfatase precursor [Posidoniimonas polymericola]
MYPQRLSYLQLSVLTGLVLCSGPARAQPAPAQPNIVLIMVDDAGYNEFGFSNDLFGQTRVSDTPNIDALASQATVFSQGYVSAPLCSPSRAGMLTGQYGSRFGWENNPSNDFSSTQGLVAGQLTMGNHLQSLGYTTGVVGKWHLGYQDGLNRPQDMGFDEFFGLLGGGRDYWPWPGASERSRMRRGDVDVELSWGSEGDPSLYDPTRGRYLTDAFGEESADFINRHAGSQEPFFLYTAITAPHTPIQVKQSDLDHFDGLIDDPDQKKIAALNYAADRAVGMIMDALVANGVDDNTVVVFLNDNGAPALNIGQSNSPFFGTKGQTFDGGIRVPFLMKTPGVAGQVYDQPITARDLLPTFYAMAGGDPTQLDVDGVDLTPYVNGDVATNPHDVLFWRGDDGRFAVRKGDWKLVRPLDHPFARLNNMVWDPSERTYYNGNSSNGKYQHIVDELNHELTHWEATLERPKWSSLGALVYKTEDHFVFRTDQSAVAWSTLIAWRLEESGLFATLRPEDAYANAILEFTTSDAGDYTSTNDMRRSTLREFMLNEVRFTGDYNGADNHQATINRSLDIGMVFVNNLAGEGPKLRIDATAAGAGSFDFEFDQIAYLVHDLEITGDGTQLLRLTGATMDYDAPTRITKTGSSTVALEGLIDVASGVSINEGALIVDATAAELHTAGDITLATAGSLELRQGRVRAGSLNLGGAFAMTGGELSADLVVGDLSVAGGRLAPGESIGSSLISGDLQIGPGGAVEFELSAAGGQVASDVVVVTETAVLAGAAEVIAIDGYTAAAGQVFPLLVAQSIVDSGLELTRNDAAGLDLVVINGESDMLALLDLDALPGDFNGDGSVDAADYTVWRDNQGATGAPGISGDADNGSGHGIRDGVVDQHDFNFWRTWYGIDFTAVSSVQLAPVPEPSAGMLLLASLGIVCRRSSRRVGS